jgi:hypothetical protein
MSFKNQIMVVALAGGAVLGPVGTLKAQDPKTAAPKAKTTTRPASKEPKENEMGHIHYLDYRNGFRGVKFGSPMSAIPGLQSVRESNGMKIYQKPDDNLQLGEYQLEKIYYHFYNDKFIGVSLFSKDPDERSELLDIFEMAFGSGATAMPHAVAGERTHADEFLWRGKVANARLYFTHEHLAEAWIGNNELADELAKAQKKKAEDAAATLN